MTTYTHSFDTEGTSSVIDEVFYNADTQELYVQLIRTDWYGNEVVAGYAGVPQDIYDAMDMINTSRVKDGNAEASVGSYWNIFVKPNFTGLNTDGLDLEPAVAFEPDDEAVSFFTSSTADVEVEDVAEAEEVSVDEAELLYWTLTFDSETTEGEFAIFATDLNDVVQRFAKIAEIAGLKDAVILSATVHLV